MRFARSRAETETVQSMMGLLQPAAQASQKLKRYFAGMIGMIIALLNTRGLQEAAKNRPDLLPSET